MAMDHFREEIVVKRRKGAQDALYYLATVLMGLLAVIAFFLLSGLMMQFSVPDLIVAVIAAGSAVWLFLRKDQIRTEFEYTFTNGELDFAQVYNNQKRKNLGTMRVKNVEDFGAVNSEAFQKLLNMPGLERKNWFLNRDAALYYFYYRKESKKVMIVLEPSPEMVELIQKYLPQGIGRA